MFFVRRDLRRENRDVGSLGLRHQRRKVINGAQERRYALTTQLLDASFVARKAGNLVAGGKSALGDLSADVACRADDEDVHEGPLQLSMILCGLEAAYGFPRSSGPTFSTSPSIQGS
jgi:hypothetical protein